MKVLRITETLIFQGAGAVLLLACGTGSLSSCAANGQGEAVLREGEPEAVEGEIPPPEDPTGDAPPFPPFAPHPSAGPDYEPWPVFAAETVVSDELLSSPHHTLHPCVYNDSRHNHFLLESDYGAFPAASHAMLEIRAHELYAIATLREMKNSEAFRRGLGAATKDMVTGPFRAVRRILRNPLNAIKILPKDAIRAVELVAGTAKIVGTGFDKKQIKNFIGYLDAREDLAASLGVDPNSSNPVLQQDLNDVAWAFYGGGAPVRIADQFIPGIPIPGLSLWGGGIGAGRVTRLFQPGSANRKMRRMDVPKGQREALRAHPHLSGRQLDTFAGTVFAMKEVADRHIAFDNALFVHSELGAMSMVREAKLLWTYHDTVSPLTALGAADDQLLAFTGEGRVILPVDADHLIWTPELQRRIERVRAHYGDQGEAPSELLLTTGTVSEAACRQLSAWGVDVWEDVPPTVPE